MMRLKDLAICGFVVGVSLAITPAARAQAAGDAAIAPARKCADLSALKLPGMAMQITKTTPTAAVPDPPASTSAPASAGVPGYCLAEGNIDPHTGPDGKPYAIGFAIALPDQWNGRFLFQGGGGLDGVVRLPVGNQATGNGTALARGFAVVSTDSGHEGANFDASFNKDQRASLDFAYIAIGRVTVAAKQIISKYYGQPARHSYFVGCSTGGRQGMLVTQRYPNEFDGVVSGDPAMRTGISGIGGTWAAVAFNQVAPKDANGKPDAKALFSDSDKKLITQGILDACDTNDGLKDGMIFNMRACHFDPTTLVCKEAKADGCLSSDQADALAKAFAGPKDSRGDQVYAAYPFDSGVAMTPTPTMFGTFLTRSGGGNPAMTINVDQRELAAEANPTEALTDTTWTNLSSFSAHGGKLIFFHGLSDPVFSPLDTLNYYERMAKDNGGMDQVQAWSRIFFVPGMNHCQGGPALDKFDLLSAVVDWVENGTAPDSVVATGKAFPGRSRPLCAYPKYARYKGQGDPQDASNFVCAE